MLVQVVHDLSISTWVFHALSLTMEGGPVVSRYSAPNSASSTGVMVSFSANSSNAASACLHKPAMRVSTLHDVRETSAPDSISRRHVPGLPGHDAAPAGVQGDHGILDPNAGLLGCLHLVQPGSCEVRLSELDRRLLVATNAYSLL